MDALNRMVAAVLLLGAAFAQAGGGAAPLQIAPLQVAPLQIRPHTAAYRCDAGLTLRVTYLEVGGGGPGFAVLYWNGGQYGLAPAISASGARYAALAGPDGARGGLEWWEHQGEGTLSTFVDGTLKTRTVLTGCKPSGQGIRLNLRLNLLSAL